MWRPSGVPAPPRRPQLGPPGGARSAAPGAAGLWGPRTGEGPGLRGCKEQVSTRPSLGEPPRSPTSKHLECPSRSSELPDHSLDSSGGRPLPLSRNPRPSRACPWTPACPHYFPGESYLTEIFLDTSQHPGTISGGLRLPLRNSRFQTPRTVARGPRFPQMSRQKTACLRCGPGTPIPLSDILGNPDGPRSPNCPSIYPQRPPPNTPPRHSLQPRVTRCLQ